MFLKWTNLKREAHVRLACGCEGFIKSIHFENDPLSSGFVFLYTVKDCNKRTSCETLYSEGKREQAFFNAPMAEAAMPAEEIPVPSWWHEQRADKTNPEMKLP